MFEHVLNRFIGWPRRPGPSNTERELTDANIRAQKVVERRRANWRDDPEPEMETRQARKSRERRMTKDALYDQNIRKTRRGRR